MKETERSRERKKERRERERNAAMHTLVLAFRCMAAGQWRVFHLQDRRPCPLREMRYRDRSTKERKEGKWMRERQIRTAQLIDKELTCQTEIVLGLNLAVFGDEAKVLRWISFIALSYKDVITSFSSIDE